MNKRPASIHMWQRDPECDSGLGTDFLGGASRRCVESLAGGAEAAWPSVSRIAFLGFRQDPVPHVNRQVPGTLVWRRSTATDGVPSTPSLLQSVALRIIPSSFTAVCPTLHMDFVVTPFKYGCSSFFCCVERRRICSVKMRGRCCTGEGRNRRPVVGQ